MQAKHSLQIVHLIQSVILKIRRNHGEEVKAKVVMAVSHLHIQGRISTFSLVSPHPKDTSDIGGEGGRHTPPLPT
jgi:hypothetical protein